MSEPQTITASEEHIAAIQLLLSNNPSSAMKTMLKNELEQAYRKRAATAEIADGQARRDIVEGRHQRRAARHERRNLARAKILAAAKGLRWDELNEQSRYNWLTATSWLMHPGVDPSGSFYIGVDLENPVEYKAAVVADHLDREQERWSMIPKSRQGEWRNVARAVLALR